MTDSTAFLYVDGISADTLDVLMRQIESVNRIGHYDNKIAYTWQITSDKNIAHAYCLGETHQCGAPEQIGKPVLLVNFAGKKSTICGITFPITTMNLINSLSWIEEQLSVESNSNTAAPIQEKTDEDTDGMSFLSYLEQYPVESQKHLLTWDDAQVLVDAASGRILTSCTKASDLMKLLLSDKKAKCGSGSLSGVAFPYDAVMWSFGLHGKMSERFLKNYDLDTHAFRLKKWPLFGRWETEPKLLMLTTLFTQKFTNIGEAVIRSGLDKERVLHFLYAAEKSRLPVEKKEMVNTAPVSAKRDVAWVNELRNKLRVNESFSHHKS